MGVYENDFACQDDCDCKIRDVVSMLVVGRALGLLQIKRKHVHETEILTCRK